MGCSPMRPNWPACRVPASFIVSMQARSVLMVVALDVGLPRATVRQLQARSVRREYWAISSLASHVDVARWMRRFGRDPRNPVQASAKSVTPPARVWHGRSTGIWRSRCVRTMRHCPGSPVALKPVGRIQIRVHLEHLATRSWATPYTAASCLLQTFQSADGVRSAAGAACVPPRARPPTHKGADYAVVLRPPPAIWPHLQYAGLWPRTGPAELSGRKMMASEWIRPEWPVPLTVHALITTRAGGSSTGPTERLTMRGMNLGLGSEDEADRS